MGSLARRVVLVLGLFGALPCAAAGEPLAIVGATVLASPTARPIRDGVVLVQDGVIRAVGGPGEVALPPGATRVDGKGMTVVAGFWNCHVHFTGKEWEGAASAPRERLAQGMERMLTRWGFVSVMDAGSFLGNTRALRDRVERGEVPGPRILTAGESIFPKDGIPIYLREVMTPEEVAHLAQPTTPEEAKAAVEHNLAGGADAIKIFTGSWLGKGQTVEMPLDIIQAAAAATHRVRKPLLAHPQTREGLVRALDGGVDVLMHTTPDAGPWEPQLAARLVSAHMALVPTLGLWMVVGRQARMPTAKAESFVQAGVAQLKVFSHAGGEVLFGTDVGFHDVVDTGEELVRMAQAGLGWREILASMTTAPARRFGVGSGTITPGEPADLVLFRGEPVRDPRAFSKVVLTVRGGRVLYRAQK